MNGSRWQRFWTFVLSRLLFQNRRQPKALHAKILDLDAIFLLAIDRKREYNRKEQEEIERKRAERLAQDEKEKRLATSDKNIQRLFQEIAERMIERLESQKTMKLTNHCLGVFGLSSNKSFSHYFIPEAIRILKSKGIEVAKKNDYVALKDSVLYKPNYDYDYLEIDVASVLAYQKRIESSNKQLTITQGAYR